MPDLLLELLSEEIPARMQARAAEDLRKLVTDRLVAAGLVYEGAKAFATPRRLALAVHGVPARQPDVKEEKKGPRVGAPEGAIAGFLRAAGLASIDQAKVEADKKGDFYIAVTEKPGRPAIDVIAQIIPEVIRLFPWPKSMRWGERSAQPGALNWVRPLHSIVATFGPETEEPEIVPFEIGGIVSGGVTRGHRFLAPEPLRVKRFDDYVAKLEKAKVVLDAARRQEIILADAKNLAFAQGFELVEDAALLAEVAGLVEWPVVLMGSFDEAFLAIPPEVIRTTIRANQKCFVMRDTKSGKLASRFLLTANIEATDDGKAIIAGNERVIRARLSDAKFFYETDLKTKLEDRLPKFEQIVFHEKLGAQAERIARIERLAAELAPLVGADVEKAKRAARLCKADLLTEMVGEFPELQGLMGKYYALAQGEDASVAAASEEHYKPAGPGDRVPTDPVSIAVALADKIDTLAGFWLIGEKPTGSKDPYALRRAALGLIRIVITNDIRGRLEPFLFGWAFELVRSLYDSDIQLFDQFQNEDHILSPSGFAEFYRKAYERTLFGSIMWILEYPANYAWDMPSPKDEGEWKRYVASQMEDAADDAEATEIQIKLNKFAHWLKSLSYPFYLAHKHEDTRFADHFYISADLLAPFDLLRAVVRSVWKPLFAFLIDRLKVQLREQGARHDLVDAVFALEGQDDLLLIMRRVEALGKFLETDDGKNLLAGVKRAANILRIEEKKDGKAFTGAPDAMLYALDEERALADAIDTAKADASAAVAEEDFTSAMTAMAGLRPHVDAFFDKVTVNADDLKLRENRLKLLNEIREATRAVADFSLIAG